MSIQVFRYAAPEDAVRYNDVETHAYDGDEAATLEKISRRIRFAHKVF